MPIHWRHDKAPLRGPVRLRSDSVGVWVCALSVSRLRGLRGASEGEGVQSSDLGALGAGRCDSGAVVRGVMSPAHCYAIRGK